MSIFENFTQINHDSINFDNTFSYRFYNPERIIGGRRLKNHLNLAIALRNVPISPNGKKDIVKNRLDTAFNLMEKLQIANFCFNDTDVVSYENGYAEGRDFFRKITNYIAGEVYDKNFTIMNCSADCRSSTHYPHGAGTSCIADSFAFAGAQIKSAIDHTIELGGKCFVFETTFEGFDSLLNTNTKLESDNLAKLLKLSMEYAYYRGFKGEFQIRSKKQNEFSHQYLDSFSSTLLFLQMHDLGKFIKLNLSPSNEHNFAAILRMSSSMNRLGGLTLHNSKIEFNILENIIWMLEVIRNGGFQNGGITLEFSANRKTASPEEIVIEYINAIDMIAFCFIKAYEIFESGFSEAILERRYSSYNFGIGEKITHNSVNLELLEKYVLENSPVIHKITGDNSMESKFRKYILGMDAFGEKIRRANEIYNHN